jgi:undecaprenyl diphosphate synthase
MSLEQLLAWIPPGSPDETLARQVNFDQLPAHIAIIMDGNGRWAAQRHLPRVEGHRAGIESVRDVVETSARLGIDVLTLYAFSIENWKRPRTEVATLMMLLKRYIRSSSAPCSRTTSGSRSWGAPTSCRRTCRTNWRPAFARRRTTAACCSTSRSTTAAARRSSTRRAARSPPACAQTTSTSGGSASSSTRPASPIPICSFRTSGEMRISNFLLWQIAYSEIWVTETLWPDFRRRDLLQAVVAYQKRDRRYGGIKPSPVAIGRK